MYRQKEVDIIIIGGGFYGCMLALKYRKKYTNVTILEKENDLLLKASYVNQARIHNGYHYPRAFLTAIRSHANFNRFQTDFKSCIYTDFDHYYAIAANTSKTTGNQFIKFCKQVNLPLENAPKDIKQLFDPILIENVFKVKEYVFDASLIRLFLKNKLVKRNVRISYDSEVLKITSEVNHLTCHLTNGERIIAKKVINCTYAGINRLLANSNIETLSLKHESVEMPIIKVPEELKKIAVTIMDGAYFGFLPFPDKKAHSLWHVRYAVENHWETSDGKINDVKKAPKSKYIYMLKDAQRYIPLLSQCKYIESLYETKTLLTDTESNDGRPILYKKNYGLKNLDVVMGGKIDNIYDILRYKLD